MLKKYENKDWQQVIPSGDFPKLLKFRYKGLCHMILDKQILLTANREQYAPVSDCP